MSMHPSPGASRALMLLTLGGLLATCCWGVSRTLRERRAGPSTTRTRLETWENEGGRPTGQPVVPEQASPRVPPLPGA